MPNLATAWIHFPVEACPMDMFILDSSGVMVARTEDRKQGVSPAGWGHVKYLPNADEVFDAWEAFWKEHEIEGLTATAAANLLNQLRNEAETVP